MGISFDQLGEPETAVRYLEQALALEPTNPTALSALADIWADQERLEEAVVLYQRALRVVPSDTYTWINLGDTLARQQRPGGDVVRALRRQGFTEEELPKALFYLGRAYADQRQVRRACRVWLQARTFHLPDWKLRVALARELEKQACEAGTR